MKRSVKVIFIVLICIMFFQVFPVWGEKDKKRIEWTGKLKDGTVITEKDLTWILKEHQELYQIDNMPFGRGENDISERFRKVSELAYRPAANLVGANLSRVDLSGFNLSGANLENANLMGAKLSGAILSGANLKKANLVGANLIGALLSSSKVAGIWFGSAVLNGANLKNADLSGSDLMLVNLAEANLSGADLSEANLSHVDLSYAKLKGANLNKTDLNGSRMIGSDLENAQLYGADLIGANLFKADLSRATLQNANLAGATLHQTKLLLANIEEANLSEADLTSADLRLSNLNNADLSGAILMDTNLTNAKLHNTYFMGDGLPEMSLDGVMSHRDSERLNACYITLAKWKKLAKEGGFYNMIKSSYNLILLDLTGQYGLKPGRSLIILLCLIPYFAIFYIFALKTKDQKTGIWLILSKEHIPKTAIQKRSFQLIQKFPQRTLPAGVLNKIRFKITSWCRMLRIAIFFSLLSTFKIGFGTFNTQSLITRLQHREYILKGTGWVRTLSGIQSLISIFLLILWLMITFGRPF